MDQRQCAQLGAALEGGEHLVVLDHQCALVGHEVLEGVDPSLHHVGHLVEDLLGPAGDGHVVGNVDTNLVARFSVPVIERVEQGAVLAG